MNYPRYPAYKDSGVEWIGDVPDHWEVKRLGSRFSERREKVSDTDFPPLSVTKQGILPQLDAAAKTDDGDNRKLVRKGDFVINSRSDRKGSAGVSSMDGSVSLINIVLTPRSINTKFINFLLRSKPFQEEFYRYGRGIVADLWSTRYSDMSLILLPLPPLAEQRAIAAFLDAETARIDALIAKQAALVTLLQEKRRALISHAVTKGLDPAAPMRDSGVAWLGAVPAGWEVKRLKYCLLSLDQGWSPQCENRPAEGNEWGILKVGCVNGNTFDPTENKALPDDLEPIESLIVCLGDVLISRANTRELVGSAAVVSQDHPNLLLCDKLYRLRIDPKQSTPEYVTLILRTPMVRVQMEVDATGASQSMQNISQSTIRNLVFVFPPVPEQIVLLNQITSETAQIDTLIAKAEAFSAVLREHRTALIAAAVTGQIDVRGIGC